MIYFIGAGPGDPELISVKGARLLAQADYIIYAGSLVNPQLLNYAPAGCRVYNSAELSLEEVIAIMQEAAATQSTCVRLHTGDPSLYGAIREQMDILRKLRLEFAVCPGISSFAAAAAALECEYTLPEVSQSLIITRIEGRTPVPQKEALRSFAQHETSMVLFLSTAHLSRVQKELIAGGYRPDTAAAIVYKASWPEEKIYRTDLQHLAATAEEAGIKNFALILVGDFLDADYARSKLYDPSFSTAFRPACSTAKTANRPTIQPLSAEQDAPPQSVDIAMLAFSERGFATGQMLQEFFRKRGEQSLLERCPAEGLSAWTARYFKEAKALIFLGATGIAVRAIAPYVQSKLQDPAVLVIDESRHFVLPLLSGHLGGANHLAAELAELLQATPVITTATDTRGLFAVDEWTRQRGYKILNPQAIKSFSAALLRGDELPLQTPFTYSGELPAGLRPAQAGESPRLCVSWRASELASVAPGCLQVVVPCLVAGLGCKKGLATEILEKHLQEALHAADCHPEALQSLASLDLKQSEPALLALSKKYQLPFNCYTAEQLNTVQQSGLHHSDFVQKITGTDNVAERAALYASEGRLILPRQAAEGCTLALAQREITLDFQI